MLGKQGIVSGEEVEAICGGLDAIEAEIESGEFPFREELEDIHMNVETRLSELIGEAAGEAAHGPVPQRPGGAGRALVREGYD